MNDKKESEMTVITSLVDGDMLTGYRPGSPNENFVIEKNKFEETSSFIKRVKVSLTSAQIKTLNSSPVELIAAPGAGKVINLISATAFLTAGAAAYVCDAGGIYIGYKTGSIQPMFNFNQAFVQSASSKKYSAYKGVSGTSAENQSLQAWVINSDPSIGTGTLDFWLTYSIEDFN